MLKVCSVKSGKELADKAKRFLVRLTSGVVAFIILATGSGAMSKAKATSGVDVEGDEFGFVDAYGVYHESALAPEAYQGEAESVAVEETPEFVGAEVGAAQVSDDLQKKLKKRL